ncbi:ATP-binding protein [Oceanospirillum beijerinckii]|uniref:ATP-binding protein n=1 Tax=Oceanospirillum beijerinckii TaxID=64976 RepID=UPI0012FEB93C|nr:ATP-binding protein [Oceanospirillum beijerinckii]
MLLTLMVTNWSFQQGFIDYLEQGEISRAEKVAELFSQEYQEEGDWYFMEENYYVWGKTMRAAGIPLADSPRRPRPPRNGVPPENDERTHRKPPRPDPMIESNGFNGAQAGPGFDIRLAIYDQNRNPILFKKPREKIKHWLPIQVDNETVGWIGLEGFQLETDQLASSFLQQQQESAYLIAAAILILALGVAALLARQFLRPIHKVAYGAKRVASGDYSHQVDVKGQDELAQLARDFNQMTATLKRTEGLRKQWISDISHELRTPIAVLSGEIEALLDGIRQPTPERINSLYSDVQGLGQLVEDLHQLSLADQGALELSCQQVDLYKIICNLMIPFVPRLEEKGLTLELNANRKLSFIVYGDARRLTQLITNLLENSLRYTDSGGITLLSLQPQEDQVLLIIEDSTPGVPEDSLNRIFDRLYRVDKSRSRSVGGSGLGLSICKNIVEAHGGKVSASQSHLGGLKISIYLPQNAS